jgi:hypothetical protein
VLFHEYSRRNALGYVFNMEQMPNGRYDFLVRVGKKRYRYALDIHATSLRTASLGEVSVPIAAALH